MFRISVNEHTRMSITGLKILNQYIKAMRKYNCCCKINTVFSATWANGYTDKHEISSIKFIILIYLLTIPFCNQNYFHSQILHYK